MKYYQGRSSKASCDIFGSANSKNGFISSEALGGEAPNVTRLVGVVSFPEKKIKLDQLCQILRSNRVTKEDINIYSSTYKSSFSLPLWRCDNWKASLILFTINVILKYLKISWSNNKIAF